MGKKDKPTKKSKKEEEPEEESEDDEPFAWATFKDVPVITTVMDVKSGMFPTE